MLISKHGIEMNHEFSNLTLARTLLSIMNMTFARSIHDNYMLVQQSIKALHRKRLYSLFLKLDISKASDSVSWASMLEVLSHLGFGIKWRNLISNLLASIIEWFLGNLIMHRKGLHQVDPLSPMCLSW